LKKGFALISVFIILLFSNSLWAETLCVGDCEEPVKYEVTFNIKYNALTAEEAKELVGMLLVKHKDACKVEVDVKKNGGEDEGGFMIYNGRGDITLTN
jgi:hypothetical protein